jgi:imidazolonepropionase
MLIHSASQLLTLPGGPQRGLDLGRLGIISDGAVLVQDGRIEAVGLSSDLCLLYPTEPQLDALGCVVMPGFSTRTHAICRRPSSRIQCLLNKTYLGSGGWWGILHRPAHSSQRRVSETRPRRRQRALLLPWSQDRLRPGTVVRSVCKNLPLDTGETSS